MRTCSSEDWAFVVKSYVRMCTKNHIIGEIEDPSVKVCGNIIKWLIYCLVRAFGGGGLLGVNVNEANK